MLLSIVFQRQNRNSQKSARARPCLPATRRVLPVGLAREKGTDRSHRIILLHCIRTSVEDGLLLRGCRIAIPALLRKEIIDKIHTSHQGVTERARQSVWWPGHSAQLEQLVKNCRECCKTQSQRDEPLLPSALPELPFQKVGTDLFE